MEEKEETLRQKLRYDMRLRVSRTDHAFGPGVAELMEHVEATGSLSKGCKCMQMAYSKGWKILKRAEEDLGIPLVQGNRGGSNGGQTVLTPEGKEFLKRYHVRGTEPPSYLRRKHRSYTDSFSFWVR